MSEKDGLKDSAKGQSLWSPAVSELKRAMASAECIRGPHSMKMLTDVSFYRGTNCLERMHICGDYFHPSDNSLMYYRAQKGTLESLIDTHLQEQAKAQKNRPNPTGAGKGTQPLGSETN